LAAALADVPDPRDRRGVRHALRLLLILIGAAGVNARATKSGAGVAAGYGRLVLAAWTPSWACAPLFRCPPTGQGQLTSPLRAAD
jgi:hypothetical protein